MRNGRGLILVVVLAATVLAKPVRNPAGFKFEIPENWTVENGNGASVLLPPKVKVDPMREDNPEVYTVYGHVEGEDIADMTRQSLKANGITAEGVTEPYRPLPNRTGTAYLLDFKHPDRPGEVRLRIWTLFIGGKRLTLVAIGQKEKVIAREWQLRTVAKSMDFVPVAK